jgi:hypothetical protein
VVQHRNLIFLTYLALAWTPAVLIKTLRVWKTGLKRIELTMTLNAALAASTQQLTKITA